eukprot:5540130-Amphidinium_carterae.2
MVLACVRAIIAALRDAGVDATTLSSAPCKVPHSVAHALSSNSSMLWGAIWPEGRNRTPSLQRGRCCPSVQKPPPSHGPETMTQCLVCAEECSGAECVPTYPPRLTELSQPLRRFWEA